MTHQPVSVVWQCSLIVWLNGLAIATSGDQRRLTGSGSASLNLTVGSLLLSLPLNMPFVMPKTSGNAPTLLLIGPFSKLFVIAAII